LQQVLPKILILVAVGACLNLKIKVILPKHGSYQQSEYFWFLI
jgi:hypothetical protein